MSLDTASPKSATSLAQLIEETATRAAELTTALPPEAAQVLWHMDLPYVPIFTDVLYRAVRAAADRFDAAPEETYGKLIERIGPRRRDPKAAALEHEDHERLKLFQCVVGWRLQRLVEAPAGWPDGASRRAPLENDPSAPRIAVIVLSCNRLAYLRNTVHALHQTLEHPNCELIVLDNGSADGSREWLERALELGLVSRLILADENLGNARGFNVARAHAREDTELTIKLDSDICPLERGWERRLLRLAHAEPDIGIVGLSQRNHYVLRTAPSSEVAGETVIPWSTWVVGSCMGITRGAFERLGYFSEPEGMAYSWDDVDFWMRAARAGIRGYYLRDPAVAHQTAYDASLYRRGVGAKNLGRVRALVRQHAREYDVASRELALSPKRYVELPQSDDRLVHWRERD